MTWAERASARAAADWFLGRSFRERLILGVAAGMFVIIVFAGLVWRPLNLARSAALDRVDRQDALIAVLRSDGDQLKALSAAAPSATAVPAASAITQEAASRQIAIQRLERDGSRLRVVIDSCSYPVLIAWIDRLEVAHGLRLIDLELERRPTPGVVSARVTLEE